MNQRCLFCRNNIKYIDYKETNIIKRFLTSWSKIKPAIITGVCAKHQRQLGKAVKRARYMGLIPYVSR